MDTCTERPALRAAHRNKGASRLPRCVKGENLRTKKSYSNIFTGMCPLYFQKLHIIAKAFADFKVFNTGKTHSPKSNEM